MIQVPTGDHFIFMSAGMHASVELPTIITQKQQEISSVGYCFWGYGRSLGSPSKQLLRDFLDKAPNQYIFVYMRPTESKNSKSSSPATEYSVDGKVWNTVPSAIRCTTAEYALVFDQLNIVADKLDLSQSEYKTEDGTVHHGERILSTGRADKARMISVPSTRTSVLTDVVVRARLYNPMKAVLVRQ